MKIMTISDIHGGVKYLKQVLERYKIEKAERLLILGDFTGYFNSSSSIEIVEMLNEISDPICAVRGNCDNESFENNLNFGLTDIRHTNVNDKVITLTHGHIYNKYNLPRILWRYIFIWTYSLWDDTKRRWQNFCKPRFNYKTKKWVRA